MTKKSAFSRIRRATTNISYKDAFLDEKTTGTASPKQKKIYKYGRSKETILTEIELEIIDLFSRSFTNGQIGVKFPQQKKKGMMRLLNHCFKVIIEEVEFSIGPKFKVLLNSEENKEKKEKAIFHMSSNYRYKHIDKQLLQSFKKICNVYVKHHCFNTMPISQLEIFYKKLILESSSALKLQKNQKKQKENNCQIQEAQENIIVQAQQSKALQQQEEINIFQSQKQAVSEQEKQNSANQVQEQAQYAFQKSSQVEEQSEKNQIKPVSIKNKKAQKLEQKKQEQALPIQDNEKQKDNQSPSKICIQKVNIYFGYARDQTTIKKRAQEAEKRFNIYLKPKPLDDDYYKENTKKWNMDMESYLIQQFMNQSAVQPNLIIRNMMKKFGRNKLFVQRLIIEKKKEMFKQCVNKFINSFQGKTLCSQQKVKQMQKSLKSNSLSPKNYFIARFIHDFYFKDVQAISVTLLSEYMFKLSNNNSLYVGQSKRVQRLKQQIDICFDQQDRKEKQRQKARQKLKAAVTNFLGEYQLQV